MILDNKVKYKHLLADVKIEMLAIIIMACIIKYSINYFDEYVPDMPLTIPAFLGTAISILLSFKMAQSYDRWWEARKIWGAIVNDSRTLVFQLKSFLNFENSSIDIKKIAYRQMAWYYTLANSLRGLEVITPQKRFLSDEEIEGLSTYTNKSLGILDLNINQIRNLKKESKISELSQIQLDHTFVRLCDSMGKAERIKSTVFPPKYRMILRFSIYAVVVLFSISLKDLDLIFELPLILIISFIFFLLEKSAKNLQDPFSNQPTDTAMITISQTIEINIRQIIGEKEMPKFEKSTDYYLL